LKTLTLPSPGHPNGRPFGRTLGVGEAPGEG
jgi:hypothetical protein